MRVETIGDATLYLGDCRDILPTLGKVDHIITDPPYGAGTHEQHDQRAERRSDGANARSLGYAAMTHDDVAHFAEVFAAHTDGWIVWFTNFDLSPAVQAQMAARGRTTFPPLPYYHSGRSVRLAGDGPCSWTDWVVVSRTPALRKWGTLRGGYVAGPGWDDKERMGGKPTRLMSLIVSDYSRKGDLVCDPFMGAGTTGVACQLEGRSFVGIEIDPASFDTACRRIAKAYEQPRLFDEPAPKPVQPDFLSGAA